MFVQVRAAVQQYGADALIRSQYPSYSNIISWKPHAEWRNADYAAVSFFEMVCCMCNRTSLMIKWKKT